MSAPIIGALHRRAYECGADAISNALGHVEILIDAAFDVREARRDDPTAFLLLPDSTHPSDWGCRIVGELLDAGRRPPFGLASDVG